MQHNKDIIQHLYSEAINRRISSDIKGKGTNFTQYTVSARPNSLRAFSEFFEAVSQAFPDYNLTIDNMVVKGDRVMVRYTILGTHIGDFMGMAPTNENLTITGIDIFRLDKGKVIQHWDAAHQISASTQFSPKVPTPFGSIGTGHSRRPVLVSPR